jgi:hypothetical protein
LLAARTPEIGWTQRIIHRFAGWAGLHVVSVQPAPTLTGYLIILQRPSEGVR